MTTPHATADEMDRDNPVMRATLSRLASLLGGQLEAVARALADGKASPWQLCAVCARLDKFRVEVEYLRRDVGKLERAGGDDPPDE